MKEQTKLGLAMRVGRCARRAIGLGALAIWGACMAQAVLAQDVSGAQAASSVAATAGQPSVPLNGFAPVLLPTRVAGARRQKTAYQPIQNADTDSQIPEIEMFVGESRVFPAPGVARIAVGNGQILTAAALDKKEVILFANGVGTSSLFVWNEDGRYERVKINIVAGDTTRIAREVAAFLASIPHAKASIIGDKVIVEGQGLSDEDQQKIALLAKQYPQIVNFTDQQGWERMVQLDVKVVEFPMNESESFGLSWTPTGGGGIGAVWRPIVKGKNPYQINLNTSGTSGLPITDVGTTSTVTLRSALNVVGAVDMGLNAQLNALIQKGKGAILAEPQLTARSGSEAKFVAGGEIPYGVASLSGTTIVYKEYGIRLSITPTVDRDGRIRASVSAEVSSIDPANSNQYGPALLTRRTETNFNVLGGQTMVLSGLISREQREDIDKVPLLGDIPVLGALFRSKNFVNKETELVVFVTPTVVDAQTPAVVDRIEKTGQKLEDMLGPRPYLTHPIQPDNAPAHDAPHSGVSPAGNPPVGATSMDRPAQTQAASVPATDAAPPATASSVSAAAKTDARSLPAVVSGNPLSPPSPASGLASPASEPGATRPAWRVALDGLALRREPDMRSPALAHLHEGATVFASRERGGAGNDAAWIRLEVDGVDGWAAARYLQAQDADHGGARQPAMVGPTAAGAVGDAIFRVGLPRLALRQAPDMGAAVVAQIAGGDTVKALERSADGRWISVQHGTQFGWTPLQWLQPVSP